MYVHVLYVYTYTPYDVCIVCVCRYKYVHTYIHITVYSLYMNVCSSVFGSYVPVLMAEAKIYWDMDNYGQVEKVLHLHTHLHTVVLSMLDIRTYICTMCGDIRMYICIQMYYSNFFKIHIPLFRFSAKVWNFVMKMMFGD